MSEIKHFLFDLDDTLIETRKVFRDQMHEVYKILGLVLNGVAHDEIKAEFEAINNAAFRTHRVNPERWGVVLDQFKSIHPEISDTTRGECLETLMTIYEIRPGICKGVESTLQTLFTENFGLGIVTHALLEWTTKKLEWTGLDKYFDGKVYVADVDLPKDHKTWKSALRTFGLDAKYVAAVGDSAVTDMIAAYGAGIRNLYWVVDRNQWVVHVDRPPKNAHVLKNGINDLIPTLKSQGVL